MASLATAAVFVWLGMVLAISFLEAPLKFRAPGVTLALGLGIGRLVFRALNACEVVLAAVVLSAVLVSHQAAPVLTASLATAAVFAIQLVFVRPALIRRSDQVLAGSDGPRSHAHYVYVALEMVKVVALLIAGTLLLN